MEKSGQDYQKIEKLLAVIVSLLLDMISEEDEELTIRNKVRKLHNLGMRPVDIATIIGRTQTHVNKELVTIKRPKKREGGDNYG
jgi:hypothetical protein